MNIFTYIINLITKSTQSSSECEKKVIYLNGQIESLTKTIGYSIKPIEITVKPNGIVKPWQLINDCEVADGEYHTFTLDNWETVITQVYDEIRSKYVWTKNVFDCDNISLLFSCILAYSVYKSEMKLQPALGIAWSNTHAFNIFIDSDNAVYVYEPQTNDIMTLDKAMMNDTYKIRKVWFMT